MHLCMCVESAIVVFSCFIFLIEIYIMLLNIPFEVYPLMTVVEWSHRAALFNVKHIDLWDYFSIYIMYINFIYA